MFLINQDGETRAQKKHTDDILDYINSKYDKTRAAKVDYLHPATVTVTGTSIVTYTGNVMVITLLPTSLFFLLPSPHSIFYK